ncbi:MAG: Na+/H+ antiporter NhaA, partial [Eggerthellaceae bacterium]|nr:Na+/H+ antiporter NhaA [Eggerthellaceae bacterium]
MSEENVEPSLGTGSIFVPKARKNQRFINRLIHFTHSSTRAAGLMLLAAVTALVVANTAAFEPFEAFWDTEVGFLFGGTEASLSLNEIINDILMAIFFLLVGLEIKYEMTVGELTNVRQALLPIIAACGGVMFPIIIYLIFNMGNAMTGHGWGVTTATDIAFALGIMALLRDHVPNGVRVFLSTLAVADDIIAIMIIAVFYGQTPNMIWIGAAAIVTAILFIMNKLNVYSLVPYILVGVVLWYCVFCSGIHSTIAGVILAFTIPTDSHIDMRSFLRWSNRKLSEASSIYDDESHVMGQAKFIKTAESLRNVANKVVPPAVRLEHHLYPWVNFMILPLFALTNADVNFVSGDVSAMIMSPAFFGVFLGLLLGKPIGIMLLSFVTVKTKIAVLPENVNWIHMLGAAILGGVGFTMAIFVANLAFTDPDLIAAAKVGILSASF